MRTLSSTLLAAQKEASRTPYLEVRASNKIAGVVRLDWERLYFGSEDDYFHAATMPGDGSLVRVRVAPPSDGRKLYRQRIAGPGPASDFSTWTYTGQYNAVVTAAASLGSEVSIFWINSSREIRRIASTDYGATWGSPELIDYSPTTAIHGIAAAYKPNSDIALFFADQSTLYVKKRTGGFWQAKSAWDKSTGDLSGAAAVYSGDWDLMVTGKDISGSFKLWSLVYGDGADMPMGIWSALKEFDSAPADGNFEFAHAAMAKPDVFRCFYIEKFNGDESYSRPFWSNTVLEAPFTANLWREPVPFDLSSQYGVSVACHDNYCWLSSPNGIWRASLVTPTLDLTATVLSAHLDLEKEPGELTINLRDDGSYTPGTSGLLKTGSQIDFSPGFVTPSGNESSPGLTFAIESIEQTVFGGNAMFSFHAADNWQALGRWRARHQFRWNDSSSETCVKDILAFILARTGLKLEVVSQSATASGFCPDFAISPGASGTEAIHKLLSFVPDVLFVEGFRAFLVNPQTDDDAVYSYGTGHNVLDGTSHQGALATNLVRVEGEDGSGLPVVADSFIWEELNRTGERPVQITDRNLGTAAAAHLRGAAILRKAALRTDAGNILIPVNCGQQLWDVIEITDERTGLVAAKRRVSGISLVYDSRKGEFWQRLRLGGM